MLDEEELTLFEIFNSYRLTSELMKKIRAILAGKMEIWARMIKGHKEIIDLEKELIKSSKLM